MTGVKIGQKVKTVATVRPVKYANKRGTISEINKIDDEIGVWFREYDLDNKPLTVWFKERELAL